MTNLQTITVYESHALLDGLLAKNGSNPQFRRCIRNYTMALLMLDAGLRVSEVVSLRQSALLFNEEPVNALCLSGDHTKYHTERTIPLSARLKNAIVSMRERYWLAHLDRSKCYAFYSVVPAHPLTTRQVERIISNASNHSIGRRIHPHVLRHTFASRLMRTVNARIVQELLGHKNLSSTQVYTHPNLDDLKSAIDSIEKGAQNV